MSEKTHGIVIVGAGGFGRGSLDILEALQVAGRSIEFRGFLDDGPVDERLVARRRARVLGATNPPQGDPGPFVIGIGAGRVRREIDERMLDAGWWATELVHPAATIGSNHSFGDGCILAAGARVATEASFGRHVHLNLNATVGHDCTFGDYVTVHPGATISGFVEIGEEATIGTGANVLPSVRVGVGATIGAGAVVTQDVEPGSTVVGIPARPLHR